MNREREMRENGEENEGGGRGEGMDLVLWALPESGGRSTELFLYWIFPFCFICKCKLDGIINF